MFKKMKTKAKIRLGFILVLLLMAVFAAYVVIANYSTIGRVDSIRQENEMQLLTYDLASKLHEIDVRTQILVYSFDEQAAREGLASFADCESMAAGMTTLLGQAPVLTPLRDLVDLTTAEIALYKQNFTSLQAANEHLAQVIEQANIAEDELLAGCAGILNYQVELMREEASQVLATDFKIRRADRVEMGFDIAERFMTVASGFNVIFAGFDFTHYDANMALLDETIDILQEFVDGSTLAYNIETGGRMLETLTNFKNAVIAFRQANDSCDVSIQGATGAAEKAQSALFSLSDKLNLMVGDQVTGTANMAQSSLVVILVVAILLIATALIVSEVLSNNISRPIALMHSVIDQVGLRGDMEIDRKTMEKMRVTAEGGDGVSQSIASFLNLIKHFTRINENLSRMADGDLSFDVQLLSERDTIGRSMADMMDKLNQMFGMAGQSAHSVYMGSKQISEGSSSLAAGATEQAATINLLTESIHELADQTRESANMANKAVEITAVIKSDVEKGNEQMDNMLQAVKDINDASHSIDKVISVIDSIAFQTNILALNASVEAARAGQHGKGFAVVAEEVRSLAAKSAEAAKNTGTLIADTIAKADYGARTASDTAESLRKIVDSINESTRLMDSIASRSNSQAQSIMQINQGIDQVSGVVQQNAAAAEQSAASSESMNMQAMELQDIVEQFKLRESSSTLSGGYSTLRLTQ